MSKKYPWGFDPKTLDPLWEHLELLRRSGIGDAVAEMARQAEKTRELYQPLIESAGRYRSLFEGVDSSQRILRALRDEVLTSTLVAGDTALAFDRIHESWLHAAGTEALRLAGLQEELSEAGSAMPFARLESELQRVAEVQEHFRRAAVETLGSLDYQALGAAVGVTTRGRERLQLTLDGISRAYERLYEGVQAREAGVLELPQVVVARPAEEIYAHAAALSVVTVSPDSWSPTPQAPEREFTEDAEEGLDSLLAPDEALWRMWKGALEALASNNPDRVRHFLVSGRELLTQILHARAPDEAVKAFTNDPDHFKDGRPTRAARLLYMARNVNHGPMTVFLKKDVAALLALIDVFQRVHEALPSFSEGQLRILRLRLAGALRQLLELP